MRLSDVIGHEAVIAGLRAAFQRDRVPHAYLFAGPDGVGKEVVAASFARLLMCRSPAEGPDGCGTCRACRMSADGRHPDLVQVAPDGPLIKIAQIREVIQALRYPPLEAPNRVVIVHEAERMHEPAANALLKTLEEPTPRNVFILVTAHSETLLATIRSRCQQVRFTALDRELVADWLRRMRDLAPALADELAAMSGGSLGEASKLTDPAFLERRDALVDTVGGLARMGHGELLALAEGMGKDKESLPQVLDILRMIFRDALLRASGAEVAALTFRGRPGAVPSLSAPDALDALDLLGEAEKALRRNVNPRMVAERVLLGLRGIRPRLPATP